MQLQLLKPSFDVASPASDSLLRELHMGLAEQATSSLTNLVKRYHVCWEVWPEYRLVGGAERQVGFELKLSGTHESATQHIGPGCPTCRRIFSALHSLTEYVLPRKVQPSLYQIGPYEVALRYSAARGGGAHLALSVKIDLTLKVKIVYPSEFDQAIDECGMRGLLEMKEDLSELGTCEYQWSLLRQHWREQVREQPELAQYRAMVGSPTCAHPAGTSG
jgi:hypothetical protein